VPYRFISKSYIIKLVNGILTYLMEKIKSFIESSRGKDILTVLIVILVGLGGFGLGRLSKAQNGSGVQIEYLNGPISGSIEPLSQGANVVEALKSEPPYTARGLEGNFFASSRGKKYYPVGCSAGDSLKMENRIYFNTREEAEKAGYTLSSSCR